MDNGPPKTHTRARARAHTHTHTHTHTRMQKVLHVSRLTPDYLGLEQRFHRATAASREAPAVFKHQARMARALGAGAERTPSAPRAPPLVHSRERDRRLRGRASSPRPPPGRATTCCGPPAALAGTPTRLRRAPGAAGQPPPRRAHCFVFCAPGGGGLSPARRRHAEVTLRLRRARPSSVHRLWPPLPAK